MGIYRPRIHHALSPVYPLESTAHDLEHLYQIGTSGGTLDDLLIESIDEALADLLGRHGRAAVYDHLAGNPYFPRREIVKHLDAFLEVLGTTFGKGGAVIGKTVIKKLHSKLEWEFVDTPDYRFADHLQRIRTRIARECIDLAKANSIR